jgi:hypothetical protein
MFQGNLSHNQEPHGDEGQRHVVMPALPGPHLVLVHARFTLAPFEARFNAGTRLDDPRQFRQRRLCQLPRGHARRTEVVMIAVAGILIGGIARGARSPCAVV